MDSSRGIYYTQFGLGPHAGAGDVPLQCDADTSDGSFTEEIEGKVMDRIFGVQYNYYTGMGDGPFLSHNFYTVDGE